jgi:Ca2+:H+ antiporter
MKKILKPGIHYLFIFIPISIILEKMHASAPLVFFSAALSIIPIARLIGSSTEQLAKYTGDAVGGLLNATFGNLPELIIAIVALKAGLHTMVLASLAGAILANLLLATGASFLVGGTKFHNQDYNVTSIRVYSSMMMIAVISLTIPSGFHILTVDKAAVENENSLNLYLAIVLLIGYVLYLFFMIKTHADFFKSEGGEQEEEHEEQWSITRALVTLVLASVLAAFMSEVLVDLSIGIALGSSIQIALFVAPVLVIMSMFIGPQQMNLNFPRPLIVAMFLTVILAAMVSGDGRSNWYKGVQLIMVYLIMGMMLYFIPTV